MKKNVQNQNIAITSKNHFTVNCEKNEFITEIEYLKYKKNVKKFNNNTKYYFEFKCFNCEANFRVYHWTIKCNFCKFRFDILNSFLTKQELTLSGYWDIKNVTKRFKKTSIYL